jgi:hypothetical protein
MYGDAASKYPTPLETTEDIEYMEVSYVKDGKDSLYSSP